MRTLIISIYLTLCSFSANAQTPLSDDQIQNVITFAHSRTMGLDHFKYFTGSKVQTVPLRKFYYSVELFKTLPQAVNDELTRFDGLHYFIPEESYNNRDCQLEGVNRCSLENANYANLSAIVSSNTEENWLDNFIRISSEIEDNALVRVLKIVNTPVDMIFEGKLLKQIGKVVELKIHPQVFALRLSGEEKNELKPQQISIGKTIEGSRFYKITFFSRDQSYSSGFVLHINFSGDYGQEILLEINNMPVA